MSSFSLLEPNKKSEAKRSEAKRSEAKRNGTERSEAKRNNILRRVQERRLSGDLVGRQLLRLFREAPRVLRVLRRRLQLHLVHEGSHVVGQNHLRLRRVLLLGRRAVGAAVRDEECRLLGGGVIVRLAHHQHFLWDWSSQ